MTIDEFVYYLILKNEIEVFQSKLQERIKNKQDSINEKLKQMNKLAEEIREELGINQFHCYSNSMVAAKYIYKR